MPPSLFGRLFQGLERTRSKMATHWRRLRGIRPGPEFWAQLEEALYEADLGPSAVETVLTALAQRIRQDRPPDEAELMRAIRQELVNLLPDDDPDPWRLGDARPVVWLAVGVNGTGKTTTVAKMAAGFRAQGHSVLLGAADTFRAAATEQLMAWGRRIGADVVHQAPGADPAAVAYDTVQAAMHRGIDVVLIDTAGRLHTKTPLMEELGKVRRVLGRALSGAPHATWLVLDAVTGQNGLEQARQFRDAVEPTGIVLTKLDGTAKGGIVFQIYRELNLPVRWIGVGEGPDDLMPFRRDAFVEALVPTGALE